MIHPIRPVGWSALSAPAALYALCRRLLWPAARWEVSSAAGTRWLIPLALRAQWARETAAPATWVDRSPPTTGLQGIEPWQPWPAHPPYADEVTRWWPSDDWPPDEPAILIEDRLPDRTTPLIEWRTPGGALDFWA